VLIDLHCHTKPLSACSGLTVHELVRLAKARGLDGICLTEHDRFWPDIELEVLSAEHDFLILGGVELTTDSGHVLAYGLSEAGLRASSLEQLRAAATASNALLYLAHPARGGQPALPSARAKQCFDGAEAVNGSDTGLQNIAAGALARGLLLPGIGGSDAHAGFEVGRAATRFERAIGNQSEFLAELWAGRYEAVALYPEM
jgi:predicted metal-dependent phosphoesterase TrpH